MRGSRWVGKVSKAKKKIKKKMKPGGGRGENKVAKKKTEIRAETGQTKKVNLGWHRERESYQCTIHPRWRTAGCCFTLAVDLENQELS